MGLFFLVLILAAVAFWAGFRAAPHPWQYKSQAGFVVLLGLAGFTGYFAWREHRTVAELSRLIDPVPEITDVMHVPTPAEIQAISRAAAAVPGEGRGGLGTTPDQRREFAASVEGLRARYWKLETSLSLEQVADFYRYPHRRNGWNLTVDEPPWLAFQRTPESLTVFIQADRTSPRTKVWYIYDPGM